MAKDQSCHILGSEFITSDLLILGEILEIFDQSLSFMLLVPNHIAKIYSSYECSVFGKRCNTIFRAPKTISSIELEGITLNNVSLGY